MSLLVALPLYREVTTEWLVRFLNFDKTHWSAIRYVRKMYLAAAMGKLVEAALECGEPWTRMVIYEADMLPPEHAFDRILAYPDDVDIVGSVYFQHPPPHNPVIYTQSDEHPNQFTPLRPNQIDDMMSRPPGLYPVDAVGMGFTSIHRRVFENWDPSIPMWGGEMFVGHDLWFTWKARQQGYSALHGESRNGHGPDGRPVVFVDTGIHCGHLTDYPLTYRDHKAAVERLKAEDAETADV